jgi:hypothetical protein
MGFETFGFSQELLDGLDAMNFSEPTPIQQQAIPEILAGKDLIATPFPLPIYLCNSRKEHNPSASLSKKKIGFCAFSKCSLISFIC